MMKAYIGVCLIILTLALRAVADNVTTTVTGQRIIDTSYPGWIWSSMAPYNDDQLTHGTGRAGGPGSYGAYTFNGTGVAIYALKAPAVQIDGRAHKVGRLRILIDGTVKAAVALSGVDADYDYRAYEVEGLPAGNHVLQLEPDAGWAVVDGIQVTGGPDAGAGTSVDKPLQTGAPRQVLFYSKDQPLSADNTVVFRNDVAGFLTDITPELVDANLPGDWGPEQVYAHSGSSAIRYSGTSTGGDAYCGMYAYKVRIPITGDTVLTYWILPQEDNGRYVAVDLHLTDGTTLSSTAAADQNGNPVAPNAGHGGRIPTYNWTLVQSAIGAFLNGKTVDAIWIVYARPDNPGQYRGYIDEITLYNR